MASVTSVGAVRTSLSRASSHPDKRSPLHGDDRATQRPTQTGCFPTPRRTGS
jgi:hypothetical protein